MPWYYFGFLMVIPCFAGIFAYPMFVNKLDEDGVTIKHQTFQLIWYLTLPALFNVGWASVQISNMAIVNDLTFSNRKRDQLSNNRNGFTYAANIVVLAFALLFFSVVDDPIDRFRYLCIICLSFGFFSSMFYMCKIQEPKLSKLAKSLDFEYKKVKMGAAAAE